MTSTRGASSARRSGNSVWGRRRPRPASWTCSSTTSPSGKDELAGSVDVAHFVRSGDVLCGRGHQFAGVELFPRLGEDLAQEFGWLRPGHPVTPDLEEGDTADAELGGGGLVTAHV